MDGDEDDGVHFQTDVVGVDGMALQAEEAAASPLVEDVLQAAAAAEGVVVEGAALADSHLDVGFRQLDVDEKERRDGNSFQRDRRLVWLAAGPIEYYGVRSSHEL